MQREEITAPDGNGIIVAGAQGQHLYRLVRADRSWLRRLISPVNDMRAFWVTYRMPWQSIATITYPTTVTDPLKSPDIIDHERVHVAQFATWWGPWLIPLLVALLPLPVLFSGRWFIERPAYLADIQAGRWDVDGAVDALWKWYGWCWPKPLMRRWFIKQLAK